MQLDPSGGYRWLDSFVMASIVQLATLRFCERFLNRSNDPCGRQFDQMTQAARSGKANIVEGSERSSTSKQTEMTLTDVAKASLCELRSDYETWLLKRDAVPWSLDDPQSKELFSLRLDPPQRSRDALHDSCVHILNQQKKFARWLDTNDDQLAARAQIVLISRCVNMLNHQKQAQTDEFTRSGGFREQLSAARIETRGKQENSPACPLCASPMSRRQARSGKNAGQPFWGCSAYPKCQGILPIP